MTWIPYIAYPSSQDEVIFKALDTVPLGDQWLYALDLQIDIRRNGAICPICGAIMDNPLTWMTFDYCPVYLLVCPVCYYEDSIS